MSQYDLHRRLWECNPIVFPFKFTHTHANACARAHTYNTKPKNLWESKPNNTDLILKARGQEHFFELHTILFIENSSEKIVISEDPNGCHEWKDERLESRYASSCKITNMGIFACIEICLTWKFNFMHDIKRKNFKITQITQAHTLSYTDRIDFPVTLHFN